MDQPQLLYELQNLDLRIAGDTAKVAAERAKILEPKTIREARQRLAAAETQHAGLRKNLRSAEGEIEALVAKKKAVHDKLYGGRVTVPRELSALEAEEAALGHSQTQLEDRALDLMTQAEAAEQAISEAQAALERELQRWRQEGSEAHEHLQQLEAELVSLQHDREALTSQIVPSNLALYERLKPRKGNRPVAAVEKNSCQGCGVSLPSGEVQRARGANPPQLCDNCGRILYVR